MKEKTKLSIVTVSYNSVKTIEKTIRSVISQPYKNIEYIIIDGGSTDGTVEIIKKYAEYIDYWVCEADQGIYDAMNKGCDVATGDLIAFLNSDDWYDEDVISAVVKKYESTQADLIYGDITFVEEEKIEKREYGEVRFIDFCYGFPFAHPSTFIRTELQKRYGFDKKYKIAADYKLCMQLCKDGFRLEHVDKNVAFFSLGGASSNVLETAVETRNAAYDVVGKENKEYSKIIEDNFVLNIIPILLDKTRNFPNYETKDKKTYIFGSGHIGMLCLRLLNAIGANVVGVLDNSHQKCGEMVNGIEVFHPEILLKEENVEVVIASLKYGKEMLKQLSDLGMKDNIRILMCEDVVYDVLRRLDNEINLEDIK